MLLLLLLMMKNERRMETDDSSGGECGDRVPLAGCSVMFSIQLVIAAHRPGCQQGQTAVLIAAHQLFSRWMAFR